jgi:hypothetical protein
MGIYNLREFGSGLFTALHPLDEVEEGFEHSRLQVHFVHSGAALGVQPVITAIELDVEPIAKIFTGEGHT